MWTLKVPCVKTETTNVTIVKASTQPSTAPRPAEWRPRVSKACARKYPPKRAFPRRKRGNHLLSPRDYHRPCRLHFRVRNGNGCFPARIITATITIAGLEDSSTANPAKEAHKSKVAWSMGDGASRGRCPAATGLHEGLTDPFLRRVARRWTGKGSICTASWRKSVPRRVPVPRQLILRAGW
jgi:hypothetical protein